MQSPGDAEHNRWRITTTLHAKRKNVNSYVRHPHIHFSRLQLAHKKHPTHSSTSKIKTRLINKFQREIPQSTACCSKQCLVHFSTPKTNIHATTKFHGVRAQHAFISLPLVRLKKKNSTAQFASSHDAIEGHGGWNFNGPPVSAQRVASRNRLFWWREMPAEARNPVSKGTNIGT